MPDRPPVPALQLPCAVDYSKARRIIDKVELENQQSARRKVTNENQPKTRALVEVYELLWRWSRTGRKNRPFTDDCGFLIPDTVVIQNGRAYAWFFTSQSGHFLRKSAINLSLADVERSFTPAAPYDGAPCAMWIPAESPWPEVRERSENSAFIHYLTASSLSEFVRSPGAVSGVLQKFIAPSGISNAMYRAVRVHLKGSATPPEQSAGQSAALPVDVTLRVNVKRLYDETLVKRAEEERRRRKQEERDAAEGGDAAPAPVLLDDDANPEIDWSVRCQTWDGVPHASAAVSKSAKCPELQRSAQRLYERIDTDQVRDLHFLQNSPATVALHFKRGIDLSKNKTRKQVLTYFSYASLVGQTDAVFQARSVLTARDPVFASKLPLVSLLQRNTAPKRAQSARPAPKLFARFSEDRTPARATSARGPPATVSPPKAQLPNLSAAEDEYSMDGFDDEDDADGAAPKPKGADDRPPPDDVPLDAILSALDARMKKLEEKPKGTIPRAVLQPRAPQRPPIAPRLRRPTVPAPAHRQFHGRVRSPSEIIRAAAAGTS